MSGKEGATREGDAASVLGDDNPAVRRIGNDRLAALDALASQRREAVATEAGVDIAAAEPTDEERAAAAERRDPDAADDAADDARAAEEERLRAARERERDEQTGRFKTAKNDELDTQLERQASSDERVVLEGDLSKYVIRGKVDGETVEIPLDRASRLMQKDYSADRRLEQATRIKQEAEAEKAAAAAALAQAKESGSRAEVRAAEERAAKAEESLDAVKQKLKESGDALFAGDTDSFANTLVDLIGSGRAQQGATPSVDELADAVEAKVAQKSALKDFRKTYSELVNNEHLGAMVDAEVARLMKEEGYSFEDALAPAGDAVREQVRKLATGYGMADAKSGSTARRVDRQSRKEQIDEPSTARSAQASGNGEKPTMTHSDVIAEMASARRPSVRDPA